MLICSGRGFLSLELMRSSCSREPARHSGPGAHGLGRPASYETIQPRAHAVALVFTWHMTYWVLCCGAWDLLGPQK